MILTIVITSLDRAEMLASTIRHLVVQIGEDRLQKAVEIIVVENGSRQQLDSSSRCLVKDFGVFVTNPVTLPVFRSLEKGLALSKGDYIWFFGDDDLIMQGLLSWLIRELPRVKTPIVALNRCSFREESELNLRYRSPKKKIIFPNDLNSESSYYDRIFGFLTSNIMEASFLREIFESNQRLLDNNYFNKFFLWTLAQNSGIAFLPDTLAYKRESIGRGSHFQENIDIRVKTFVFDLIEIYQEILLVNQQLGKKLMQAKLSDFRFFLRLGIDGANIGKLIVTLRKKYDFSLYQMKWVHLAEIVSWVLRSEGQITNSEATK